MVNIGFQGDLVGLSPKGLKVFIALGWGRKSCTWPGPFTRAENEVCHPSFFGIPCYGKISFNKALLLLLLLQPFKVG